MTAMRATHRLRNGQPAVEFAPGFFKTPGVPVCTRLEIELRFGIADIVDSTDSIEVSETDVERQQWLEDGYHRSMQAMAAKFREIRQRDQGRHDEPTDDEEPGDE